MADQDVLEYPDLCAGCTMSWISWDKDGTLIVCKSSLNCLRMAEVPYSMTLASGDKGEAMHKFPYPRSIVYHNSSQATATAMNDLLVMMFDVCQHLLRQSKTDKRRIECIEWIRFVSSN